MSSVSQSSKLAMWSIALVVLVEEVVVEVLLFL